MKITYLFGAGASAEVLPVVEEIPQSLENIYDLLASSEYQLSNRVIDRKIIGEMKNLSKVYFQAPDPEILKERFLTIRTDIPDANLLVRKDVKQFLLPNEL